MDGTVFWIASLMISVTMILCIRHAMSGKIRRSLVRREALKRLRLKREEAEIAAEMRRIKGEFGTDDLGRNDQAQKVREDALALIASVRAALANGTRHYQGGRLLTTDLEVIRAMLDGPIDLLPPDAAEG